MLERINTNLMNAEDLYHLNWIYQRLINVYDEHEDTDFVRKLKDIINKGSEPKEPSEPLGVKIDVIENHKPVHTYYSTTIPSEGLFIFYGNKPHYVKKVVMLHDGNSAELHI